MQKYKDMNLAAKESYFILLGDYFNSYAYYIGSRLGNREITKILAIIEENFQKIYYNKMKLTNDFEQNLKSIYEDFYNFLPTFFE